MVKHEKQHKTAIITGKKQQTAIISAKRKNKKYYSKDGTLITDPDIIDLAKQGNTIVSYREELPK